MHNLNYEMNLRHDIYFSFTLTQKRRFHSLGYETPFLHYITMSDFLRITKNKDLINKLIELKRLHLRLVA